MIFSLLEIPAHYTTKWYNENTGIMWFIGILNDFLINIVFVGFCSVSRYTEPIIIGVCLFSLFAKFNVFFSKKMSIVFCILAMIIMCKMTGKIYDIKFFFFMMGIIAIGDE